MPAALGGIFCVITDPFQMDRDARSRQNSPQVVSHRLLARQSASRVGIDFFLQGILQYGGWELPAPP